VRISSAGSPSAHFQIPDHFEKMKRSNIQTSIDSHFQRSVKLKTGERVSILPSQVTPGVVFACEFAGCNTKCSNKGALATHKKFAHPAKSPQIGNTLMKFVVPKMRTKCTSFPMSFSPSHAVSNVSILDSVDFLYPVQAIAPPQQSKTAPDGRKSNKGAKDRASYTTAFKVDCIEQYLEGRK
jgi:hypothetical protein